MLKPVIRFGKLLLAVSALFISFAQPLWAAGVLNCSAVNAGGAENVAVNLRDTKGTAPVNATLLGVNALYWIDDDKAWEQGLGERLKQLKISTLRFPGGEVADNFDWEQNALERPDQFPKEATTPQLKAQRLDYLEFLEQARKIGAENLFFVVNLEGAFLAAGDREENILRYAQKAGHWVTEVKRHGYHVKYWEIGNESYLKQTSYPMTSAEYAHALSIFAREMRKADPSILIAALGPEGIQASGFADSLTPEQLRYFRSNGNDICANRHGPECLKEIRRTVPGVAQPVPWWEILLRDAPADFDAAVIHNYGTADLPVGRMENRFQESNKISKLQNLLDQGTGRHIWVEVTEWNVPKNREEFGGADIVLDNAIKLGNYMAAGVDHALFWPVRFKNNDDRALLSFDGSDPTAMYRAFDLLSPMLSGAFVEQLSLGAGIYFLQTRAPDGERVLLVNRGKTSKQVSVDFTGNEARETMVNQVSGQAMSGGELCHTLETSSGIALTMPPDSLTVISLTK